MAGAVHTCCVAQRSEKPVMSRLLRGARSPSSPGCLTLPSPHLSQVAKTLDKLEVAYWRKEPVKTADKAASNHGISAMKFQLIKVGSEGGRRRGRR